MYVLIDFDSFTPIVNFPEKVNTRSFLIFTFNLANDQIYNTIFLLFWCVDKCNDDREKNFVKSLPLLDYRFFNVCVFTVEEKTETLPFRHFHCGPSRDSQPVHGPVHGFLSGSTHHSCRRRVSILVSEVLYQVHKCLRPLSIIM